MKKITSIFAMFIVLMTCVVMSCGSSSSGGDEPNNGGDPGSAKFLTEDEFARSSWKGEKDGKELTLDVTSKTSMTLKYYVLKTLSKNTDPEYDQVTVNITYAFDAAKGVATGSANNVAYVATLTAKDKLDFTMGSYGVVKLTKK
ncbi:MAG: hypothetical protein J6T96_15430 [Bacteroidales bacterium]|nr:hypothetical protein [Bacteroidales bacterium]MBO7568237.1 hypothetical protein [Bacteroidales bacterium]